MFKKKHEKIDAVLVLLLFFPSVLWRAFVIYKLYGWHCESLFDSMPHLTYKHTVGLIALLTLFQAKAPTTSEKAPTNSEESQLYSSQLIGAMITHGFFLFIGWITL